MFACVSFLIWINFAGLDQRPLRVTNCSHVDECRYWRDRIRVPQPTPRSRRRHGGATAGLELVASARWHDLFERDFNGAQGAEIGSNAIARQNRIKAGAGAGRHELTHLEAATGGGL